MGLQTSSIKIGGFDVGHWEPSSGSMTQSPFPAFLNNTTLVQGTPQNSYQELTLNMWKIIIMKLSTFCVQYSYQVKEISINSCEYSYYINSSHSIKDNKCRQTFYILQKIRWHWHYQGILRPTLSMKLSKLSLIAMMILIMRLGPVFCFRFLSNNINPASFSIFISVTSHDVSKYITGRP